MEEKDGLMIRNLIKEYGTEVMRICMIYLNDFQLAEDIVQETFLKRSEERRVGKECRL